jgi:hypothetical protein
MATVRPHNDLANDQTDGEEQHGGDDVFGLIDLERSVRAREEEVVGHRGDHRRDDACPATSECGGDDDHHDEHEGRVRTGDVVAYEDEEARYDDRSERRDPEAGGDQLVVRAVR